METFFMFLVLCVGNSPVMQSFDVFFDQHLSKRLSTQCDAGDLRRHYAHCDITVMLANTSSFMYFSYFNKWNTKTVLDIKDI